MGCSLLDLASNGLFPRGEVLSMPTHAQPHEFFLKEVKMTLSPG